jgi:hypothetical protein
LGVGKNTVRVAALPRPSKNCAEKQRRRLADSAGIGPCNDGGRGKWNREIPNPPPLQRRFSTQFFGRLDFSYVDQKQVILFFP